jgi:hypothetical protein
MSITIKIQEYISTEPAEAGTDDNTIIITDHGLETGDMIVNEDRLSNGVAKSSYVIKVDGNEVTTRDITGQDDGDDIRLYKYIDRSDLLKSRTLRINRMANRMNSASFTLRVDDTVLAGDGVNEFIPRTGLNVLIYDGATLVFGGTLKVVEIRRLGGGSCNTYIADCVSEGYNHIPARRTVADYFDDITTPGLTAGDIVEFMCDNYLIEEGITQGTIDNGVEIYEYPQEEVGYSVKQALDDMAEASGFVWFIDDDRELHFIATEAVGAAANTLEDGGAFTDYWDVEVTETLEDYRNKQFILGGIDDDGDTVLVGSTDFAEVKNRQDREGGSGVYGNVFENPNITAFVELTADAGTNTTTVVTTAAHGLTTGDVVVNVDRNNAKRQITVTNATTFTVDTVTGQTSGDTLKTYPGANEMMRQLLRAYKGGKQIRFMTTETSFQPVEQLTVDLEQIKAESEDYLIESVNIYDVDGINLHCEVIATKRDFTALSTVPVVGWIDYFRKIVDA